MSHTLKYQAPGHLAAGFNSQTCMSIAREREREGEKGEKSKCWSRAAAGNTAGVKLLLIVAADMDLLHKDVSI